MEKNLLLRNFKSFGSRFWQAEQRKTVAYGYRMSLLNTCKSPGDFTRKELSALKKIAHEALERKK